MTRASLIGWQGPMRMIILLVLGFITIQAFAAGPRRVLIVHSYGREVAPFSILAATFRTELARRAPEPLEFYEVTLQAPGPDEGGIDQHLAAYLQAMFARRHLDLIVTTAEPASLFIRRYRAELSPATPLLAVVNSRMVPMLTAVSNTTVVPVEIDLPLLIQNILQVLPATTNVLMVLGNSPFERYWKEQCQAEFAQFTNRIVVRYANDLTLDQMVGRASTLPPNSAVLYGMLAIDAAGVPYEQERALSILHAQANAPLFGVLEHQLGNGIVGGRLVSMEALGKAMAQAGLTLLQGGEPKVGPTGPGSPAYDWRELSRWAIPQTRLPPGSEVRFREPTLWEEHRWQFVGAGALGLLETVLILALLIQLRRRRWAERTLRESEERLSLATSAAKVGVWSWDIERGTIEATTECKQIFGVEPGQSVDFDLFMACLHPEDRVSVRQALKQAIQNRTIYDTQYRIVWPNKQTRWISARGRCRYTNGHAGMMMGVLVDITDRELAQQEAAQHRGELAHLARVNTLSELSGSLAHELNQPLGIILSNAQAAQRLLAQTPPDLVELQAILRDIVAADRRAGEVIQRTRVLLKRGQCPLHPLSLNEIVEEVLPLMSGEFLGRGIAVERRLASGLPLVVGDRVQLHQLLLNLMLNAADAMAANAPGARRVCLETGLHHNNVRVSVRDEGTGLPAEPERLFQPFFTTKPHGLGMGLAICRSIARAHDGKLWAERHPERGAVFHLELPRCNGSRDT